MHFPRVGERVWVRGCAHHFVVVRIDYCTQVATLAPVEILANLRRCPIAAIFALHDFDLAQSSMSPAEATRGLLETTHHCIHSASSALRYLRQTASRTFDLVAESNEMIKRTDQTIARWNLLGCDPGEVRG
ncbi:hypothetical protein [Occallatibacter savannae]|uniref:hypothetical protein n=1 Tax=Occallatibacter savannae TaxID=1002691 RepID=UPI000D69EE8B|nr:hypothetical protein [Occallatibacter savannae]